MTTTIEASTRDTRRICSEVVCEMSLRCHADDSVTADMSAILDEATTLSSTHTLAVLDIFVDAQRASVDLYDDAQTHLHARVARRALLVFVLAREAREHACNVLLVHERDDARIMRRLVEQAQTRLLLRACTFDRT